MFFFFFFNDTATTEIYTLSLHDALPIFGDNVYNIQLPALSVPFVGRLEELRFLDRAWADPKCNVAVVVAAFGEDRKSTRLNSSHANISYAVFCLKKKKNRSKEGTDECK